MKGCNVYQTEYVSNDQFCIVSGIPEKNTNHVGEIANFSKKLMISMNNLKVRDLPEVSLKIRIGIYTG